MKDFFKVVAIGMIGIIVAIVYLGFLCKEDWCISFSLSKISKAVDFASCRELGFPISKSHPPRCTAGVKSFLQDDTMPLRVFEPEDDVSLGLPLSIKGEVLTESGTMLLYRLSERDGYTLREDAVPLPQGGSGQYVAFHISASYPKPLGTGGTLEVFEVSGTKKAPVEKNRVTIPVTFAPVEAMELKIFFGNSERDPQSLACDVSYPVPRRIAVATKDLPQAVLQELLRGPSLGEQNQKFFTSIPEGVSIRTLSWNEGRLTIDLSGGLTEGVAGSCRVMAIRSQIERTVKQFPSVTEVVITVDGLSEEVLQP
ncbi:MAG: GerMN domain-containing protein [Candidatus Peribacteraceae bacterium]|nr:GerMN domain-containing protein [Candidatus Peribacteraceae bacterium]MDD5075368.1 GerMN domain-containing protein [Candidatus Peribacteraceae bacterium]